MNKFIKVKGVETMRKISRKTRIVIISIAATLLLLLCAAVVYVGDYYRADTEAIDAYLPLELVETSTTADGYTAYLAKDAIAGVIFYPGGKVEARAYAPLMAELALRGITSVLVEMPYNLAVLDMNAADGIPDEFPDIENWYMVGHSLGGAMAASYAAGHTDELSGLILLGAYSTADLSDSSLSVLCLHGSEDMIMNREKHDECLDNLPAGYTEREIEGGCHAYFGMYGEQDGDGEPTLTEIEQITLTANYIADFILGGS